MKQLFYKSLVLFLAFTGIVVGQKYTVLKKSFDIGIAKVLELDLENVPLIIEESNDGKIHLNLDINFKNFTSNNISKIIDGVNFSKKRKDDVLSLNLTSTEELYERCYYIKKKHDYIFASFDSIIKKWEDSTGMKWGVKRLTKDRIIKSLKYRSKKPILKFALINGLEKKNEKKSLEYETNFVLKMPKNSSLKINSKNALLNIKIETINKLNAKMSSGSFRAKSLINSNIEADDLNSLRITKSHNNKIKLKSAKNVTLGEIENSTINTELSLVKLGEIRKNVELNDFNSKYYLYNFYNEFKNLTFNGEYSKVYLFGKKENYSLDIFGSNTAIELEDGIKTTFGIKKNNELDKLLSKKKKKFREDYMGHVKMTILNGFVFYRN